MRTVLAVLALCLLHCSASSSTTGDGGPICITPGTFALSVYGDAGTNNCTLPAILTIDPAAETASTNVGACTVSAVGCDRTLDCGAWHLFVHTNEEPLAGFASSGACATPFTATRLH